MEPIATGPDCRRKGEAMSELQTITRSVKRDAGLAGFAKMTPKMAPKLDDITPKSPALGHKNPDMIDIPNMKTMHVILCGNRDVINDIARAMESSEDALGLKSMESALVDYKPNCVSISIKLKTFDITETYRELEDKFFTNMALICGASILEDNQMEEIKSAQSDSLESINLSFQVAFC
ncbi:MAG: hypothetical protein QW112_02880 [Candidatus Micrarchaeia archaeon]